MKVIDPDPVNLRPDPQLMTGTNLAGFVGRGDVEAAGRILGHVHLTRVLNTQNILFLSLNFFF